MSSIREFAERVLLTTSLAEKLAPPPAGLSLDPPNKRTYSPPSLPGRPEHLRPRKADSQRTPIPSARQLTHDTHRATLLHFFCNHELLAVELMALALLKFPDAPDAFRRGLLRTLLEEQEHTKLYLARMEQVGCTFGEHSLSRMIWDHISPMSSPIEYISRLSLTFEQANLDYARHYSEAFAQAGDEHSAKLLDRIYKDEIAHVGYGVKWLRRFKEQQESDWQAWHRSLTFPLSPVRAKGPDASIPFNEEGRRLAGLDDDFIQRLKLYQRSRGRTPVLHFFNPNCEAQASGFLAQNPPSAAAHDLEHDLELLIFANAHPDDTLLLRTPPSESHLTRLRDAGLIVPEILTPNTPSLRERKLGGFAPWAWTQEACQLFAPLRQQVTTQSDHTYREAYPALFFSKELTPRSIAQLDLLDNESICVHTPGEALHHAYTLLKTPDAIDGVLMKASHACAGRDQFRVGRAMGESEILAWAEQTLSRHPALVIEPLYPRLADFSALYDISSKKGARLIAFTLLETDSNGRYRSTRVAPKFTTLLPPALAKAFHKPLIRLGKTQQSALTFYRETFPAALTELLPRYCGPLAVDALFYQFPNRDLALRPIVEINTRYTMGRIAHNLRKKLAPHKSGRFEIISKKSSIPANALPLNDPAHAKRFQALWTTL